MEREIKVIPEQREQTIAPIKEPFLLGKTQNKTLPLEMAEGDQRVIPNAGFLLQSVVIEKPDTLIPDNIVKDVEIGGVVGIYEGAILPDLDNPASQSDVFSGKQYIDANGQKRTGSYHFPVLQREAIPSQVFDGFEYIDAVGNKQTGSFSYPELENPASADKVFAGFEFLDGNGQKQSGSFVYPVLSDPASAADVVQGKEFLDGNGAKQTGALDPDTWAADFLVIHHTFVTVGTNSVNTTLGVKDYILAQAGVDSNRLFAFCLRAKPSYQVGEIGRCVLYPNSSIGYFSASQWTASGWGTGRMLSGYSAVLPVGSVYDLYYWSV